MGWECRLVIKLCFEAFLLFLISLMNNGIVIAGTASQPSCQLFFSNHLRDKVVLRDTACLKKNSSC